MSPGGVPPKPKPTSKRKKKISEEESVGPESDGLQQTSRERDGRPLDDDRAKLGKLIQTATTTPLLDLDVHALASIKALVRASDGNVRAAFEFLLDRLKKNHSQVRYLTVLIIDEIFTRSKLFRSLLVPCFEAFIVFSIGFRADSPLPPPQDRADLLRTKSIELVEKWKDAFGQHYKPIRLAHNYLKTTIRLAFPNARESAALASQQRREREERTQELLRQKLVTLKEDYPTLEAEVHSTLGEIDACLKILADRDPNSETDVAAVEAFDEAEEAEEYGVQSLRQLRDATEFQESVVQESAENAALFDNVRSLYKLLSTKFAAKLQEWLATLMRVDPQEERQSRDALMRDVIDLRNQVSESKAKCEGLGIPRIKGHSRAGGRAHGEEDDDDIEWEQGDLAITDEDGVSMFGGGNGLSLKSSAAATSTGLPSVTGGGGSKGRAGAKEVSSVKQELLNQAPVLPWGTFLDRWGNDSAMPANPRGLEYENHWGRVDYDVTIPAEKIAEATIRTSYYTAPKVEIRPCLAPLRNGGLCQRRDIKRCPLHGPVVPRDERGDPVIEDKQPEPLVSPGEQSKDEAMAGQEEGDADGVVDSEDDSPPGGSRLPGSSSADPVELAKQAITNVRREQARAEARKKRAKLARDHNEACLKDAAMRTFGPSFGEGSTAARSFDQRMESEGSARKPRGGLTALLRKKPTAKDRLARRLLNGRVRETVADQLRRDEEAAYRQSFPNQWTMK